MRSLPALTKLEVNVVAASTVVVLSLVRYATTTGLIAPTSTATTKVTLKAPTNSRLSHRSLVGGQRRWRATLLGHLFVLNQQRVSHGKPVLFVGSHRRTPQAGHTITATNTSCRQSTRVVKVSVPHQLTAALSAPTSVAPQSASLGEIPATKTHRTAKVIPNKVVVGPQAGWIAIHHPEKARWTRFVRLKNEKR